LNDRIVDALLLEPGEQKVAQLMGRDIVLTGARVTLATYSYDQTYTRAVLVCSRRSSDVDLIVFDLPWMEKVVPCVDALDPSIAWADPRLLRYEDVFPVMRQGATWEGAVYGLPFAPYFVLQHTTLASMPRLD
jgi:multiple sugar transport system substrate-binding protein